MQSFLTPNIDHSACREDEAEHFAKRAQDMFKQFLEKAAISRSMTVEKMELAAQGRVWAGHDAASLGLVDAIGGLSRALAIAKQKANIPLEKQVTFVEVSRTSPSPLEIFLESGNTIVETDESVKELMDEMASSDAIQGRMDGILLQKSEGTSYANRVLMLIKDCLSSL